MALALVQWDTVNHRFKVGGSSSGSGSSGPDFRSGRSSVGATVSSLAISFSKALPSTSYAVVCTWQNVTDPFPQYQPVTVTALSVNGFTLSWNAPTDTANYGINWIVMQQG